MSRVFLPLRGPARAVSYSNRSQYTWPAVNAFGTSEPSPLMRCQCTPQAVLIRMLLVLSTQFVLNAVLSCAARTVRIWPLAAAAVVHACISAHIAAAQAVPSQDTLAAFREDIIGAFNGGGNGGGEGEGGEGGEGGGRGRRLQQGALTFDPCLSSAQLNVHVHVHVCV